MGLIKCLLYASLLGICSFLIGRILPEAWFSEDRFPYRSFGWEKNGSFYNHFGIRLWQARLPDISRVFPNMMQVKKVTKNFRHELPRMITETCIAEFVHAALCILILPCLWFWPGWGGILFVVLYILGNLPFIMIQRYNRPRLIRLRDRMSRPASGKEV